MAFKAFALAGSGCRRGRAHNLLCNPLGSCQFADPHVSDARS
jgi:hypothetical protein